MFSAQDKLAIQGIAEKVHTKLDFINMNNVFTNLSNLWKKHDMHMYLEYAKHKDEDDSAFDEEDVFLLESNILQSLLYGQDVKIPAAKKDTILDDVRTWLILRQDVEMEDMDVAADLPALPSHAEDDDDDASSTDSYRTDDNENN